MLTLVSSSSFQAVTGGTLWAMDRSTFRRIVLKSAFQKRKMYEALLEKVPLLTSLSVSVGAKGKGRPLFRPMDMEQSNSLCSSFGARHKLN